MPCGIDALQALKLTTILFAMYEKNRFASFISGALIRRFAAAITGWMLCLCPSATLAQTGPTIAAASDLKFALDEIAVTFKKQTGKSVRIIYGSSGNFYQQISQSAPFEIFMSADEDLIFKLADKNLTVDQGSAGP